MKKSIFPTIGLLGSLLTAQAQFFTNGNLAVVRIGGPNQSVTTSDSGNTVFIDQYTTNGTLVNSLAVPSTGANALILNGEPYEGLLSLTPDGSHLVMGGFHTSAPYMSNGAAANVAFSYSATVPRAIATIDGYGVYALPIANYSMFNTYVIASATSDGSNFWAEGTGSTAPSFNGVVYCGTAALGATNQVSTGLFGSGRGLNIYNNALYAAGYPSNSAVSADSGAFLLSDISGALPTNSTSFSLPFPTGPESSDTPFDLVINSANTIAYVADSSAGIVKFTNGGSGWVSNYTVVLTNAGYQAASGSFHALSVTADFTQATPVVYATTYETLTNRLVMFQDSGPSPTVVNLASNLLVTGTGGSTNTFRGVRFVPVSYYPYVTVQPVAFQGAPGQTATFSATVLGPSVAYQWYSNSVSNPTFVAIAGATSSSLSVDNINSSESGSEFYLAVSNAYGASQSVPVTLTVLNPAITSEPVGDTNLPNSGPVTLCVTAVGSGPLTYQWLANGAPIAGAQSSCYTVPNSAVSNQASYSVIVSNSLGDFATSGATVVSFSPYLLYDRFDYPNGPINKVAGSPWTEESGSNPIYVTNDFAQINENIGALGTAFVQSLFTQPQSGQILWASFIINLTNLPATPSGTYFAYFQSTNFNFYGRIIALTSNNPAYTPDIPAVAAPGTYRLGIANDQTAASAVVELDMAPGIDYQVVAYYDMVNGFCQLAVNPSQSDYGNVYDPFALPSPLASAATSDAFTPASLPMAAYGLRQAANVGVINLTDLEVSYDWNGAGSGYAAVTAGVTPTTPVIGFLTPGFTNYTGNSNVLEVAASGIGLTYQWCQNGAPLTDGYSITGSGTPALTVNPLEGTNSGDYTVIVSNSAGAVTSAPVAVSVNTTVTAPIFTLEPVSTTTSLGANVTFTASAVGTGPITYQWNTDGSPNGATGSSFTLTQVNTNLSGNTYSVTATGGTGLSTTSTNAILTVNGPIVTNIAYLRTLIVTSAAPTITLSTSPSASDVYQVTGVVTCSTNLESASYVEYTMQDSTAGIEFFIAYPDTSFRPKLGDIITVSGTLALFDDNLELDGSYNNLSEPYYIANTNGEGSPLPYAPLILPYDLPAANPGLVAQYYCGALVTITNAYFETPGALFADEDSYYVTNKAGVGNGINIYTGESDGPDVIGQPVPVFAYSVTAPLLQYEASPAEYEINVTAANNIVTSPPPAVSNIVAAVSDSHITLTWPAVAASYTYSVWSTTNLAVPFAPLATGLWFTNSTGTYTTVVSPNNPATFYEIVSP